MYQNFNPYYPPNIPVQNIINTNNVEMEGKFLKENEDVNNILVKAKTIFIDEKKQKVYIKELDGSISKTYDLLIPKDEKDIKIENLEKEILDMRRMLNEYSKFNQSADDVEQSNAVIDDNAKSTTKKSSK